MEDPTPVYNILDKLSESDFKRFKSYLSKPILDSFVPIYWGKLEKADVTDVERLMKDHYKVEGSRKMTMHIMNTLYPTEQLGKSSQVVSTGSTVPILRALNGVKCDFDSLTLESSKTAPVPLTSDDRLSSVVSPSTVTAVPRKWISCSQRWQRELRELANMEERGITKVGSLIFVPDEERYQIADTGHTEVLLGLREDGTEVAIKKIKKSKDKMVKKELDILLKKRYNSLHVVQYVDSTEDNKSAYIAMQLCEHNLEEHIGNLRGDSERKKTAKEFLEGLNELHEEGVIHGDIKPSNVLIERNGCVRLADFGISRTLDPDQTTVETDTAGTKCWEATEIVKSSSEGQYKYKQSGDIQVAGMLVYYILSGGHHPFGDGIYCQTNIVDGKYSLEHLKDKEAKALVTLMINPFNPKQRPHITEVLTHPYWEDRPVDAEEGDKEEEEEDDCCTGITHIANATEMPMRVYFSEDIIEEMLVESSQTWWTWQDKKVNFRPNACDPYICVPARTYERLLKKGPFYVSIFLESISSSGECAKIVAENVCIPNDRSFIVTKKHTFETQKYGASIWKDEQGKNHTP